MESIRVHLPEDLRMNDDKFTRFCQDNPDLKFERRKNGDMLPGFVLDLVTLG